MHFLGWMESVFIILIHWYITNMTCTNLCTHQINYNDTFYATLNGNYKITNIVGDNITMKNKWPFIKSLKLFLSENKKVPHISCTFMTFAGLHITSPIYNISFVTQSFTQSKAMLQDINRLYYYLDFRCNLWPCKTELNFIDHMKLILEL